MNILCKKCKVPLEPGIALLNQVGKVNSKGNFTPAAMVGDNETVYPVTSQVSMISVNKCPQCGYSVAQM
jgi:hypothetical protein